MEMLQHKATQAVTWRFSDKPVSSRVKLFFFFSAKRVCLCRSAKKKRRHFSKQQVYKAKTSLFVWDLLNTKVIQSEGRVTSPALCLQSELFLQVSDFASLCVLQVCVSPETSSEPTSSLVEPLSSRDVPLRRWLVSLLFPWLAVKGLYSEGKLEQPPAC